MPNKAPSKPCCKEGGNDINHRALNILYPIVVPSTSLLFFYRVRAIYAGSQTTTILFGLLWLAELAACTTVVFGTAATDIGPTRYCLFSQLAPYTGAASITPTVFDTAIFVAISYRLVGNAYIEHSWSLLVDGQMYYMITVVMNITTSVMIYVPGASPVYRSLPAQPNIMLNTDTSRANVGASVPNYNAQSLHVLRNRDEAMVTSREELMIDGICRLKWS
ncbi:hypothetical protein MVEN_02376300 [Mycena venus]|uniref:Uncharacterized protein n=1 Tax=Mycena venus TaxID=2733690 RepID=A0A8H6X2Z1_9AGAR|nr:hypothetical protein MVEN_02376300 [Mycena venus]